MARPALPTAMLDLSDRHVLVTGAAGRLGRVLVQTLAEAGARVTALDREAPPGPARGLALAADMLDEAAVADAFAQAEADGGPLDAVVHTVGMWDGAPLAETTLEAWRRVLDLNLTSAFLLFREAARRLGADGVVVGIASGQGADRAPAEQAAYAASKAGVIRLVEATAAEAGAPHAVAVAPSTLLFEGGTGAGIAAEAVAALCARLCGPDGAHHSGATLRIYGSA